MIASEYEGVGDPAPSYLAAASLVALGLSPFPVKPGTKTPAVAWRKLQGVRLLDDWSIDEIERYLQAWWDRPDPYAIGVPTGTPIYVDEERTAHLVVIDIDADDEARRLVREALTKPTPTVRTKRGHHLWFVTAEPLGNRTHVGGMALDVRGAGGYVLVPPSPHSDGGIYEWVLRPADWWPPAELPETLAELIAPRRSVERVLTTSPRPFSRRGYAQAALRREADAVRTAPVGERNNRLNIAAYNLARFVAAGELSALEVGRELLAAAVAAGLPEREAERTILSGLRARAA